MKILFPFPLLPKFYSKGQGDELKLLMGRVKGKDESKEIFSLLFPESFCHQLLAPELSPVCPAHPLASHSS